MINNGVTLRIPHDRLSLVEKLLPAYGVEFEYVEVPPVLEAHRIDRFGRHFITVLGQEIDVTPHYAVISEPVIA